MNAQDLLDHALGLLEPPRRAAIEQEIADDPALAERADRLDRALQQLLDDGRATIEPPEDLADRTIQRVVERRARRTLLDYVPAAVPFRWADVAVAALIFLAALATLVPAIHRSKARLDEAACAFNLQKLGVALSRYATAHQTYPSVPDHYPAGTYALMLHDAGLLPEPSEARCPGDAHLGENPRGDLPRFEAFADLIARDPQAAHHLLCGAYAYNAGYRDARSGTLVPGACTTSGTVPLLADAPPHDCHGRIFDGNSPNHGGGGQNILFGDGHVAYLRHRHHGRDEDIFLNGDHQAAPGHATQDFVLLPAGFPLNGR